MVRTGLSHVLTKMGLMGIQLRIASKVALPPEFELKSEAEDMQASEAQPSPEAEASPKNVETVAVATAAEGKEEKRGNQDDKT
jgi:small subunit ribosomal protein S3